MTESRTSSLKVLRRKFITWQETYPSESEVPLEIQTIAKEIAKRHGYIQLSRYLKIEPEQLFSKVGMGKIPYKPRKINVAQESPQVSVTAVTLNSSTVQGQTSLRAKLKNGVVVEVTASIDELASFAQKLGA